MLVVEDEELVRSLVRTTLSRRGYRVLDAADGEEALRVSQGHAGPIHLVVTDVVMPGMSGDELAVKLKSVRPETKVLLTSGYPDRVAVHRDAIQARANFLEKPFMPEELLRKVREVLDRG